MPIPRHDNVWVPLPSACYVIGGAKSHLGGFHYHLITLPFLEYRWKLSQRLKKASHLFVESSSPLISSNFPFKEWSSSSHKSTNVSTGGVLSSSKAYLHLCFQKAPHSPICDCSPSLTLSCDIHNCKS